MNPEKPASASSLYSVIFGLIAIALNVLLITTPIGLVFGIIALICGIVAKTRNGRSGGFIIALLSFLVLAYWLFSIAVPLWADPTLSFAIRRS